MSRIDELARDMITEAQIDDVGLWLIVGILQSDLGVNDPAELRKKTLDVVKQMIDSGQVSTWYCDKRRGVVVPWTAPISEILNGIIDEWDKLERDPGFGDIVVFKKLTPPA